VARSHDLSTALILLTALLFLNFFGEEVVGGLRELARVIFGALHEVEINQNNATRHAAAVLLLLMKAMFPMLLVVAVFAIAANVLQVGFLMTAYPLIPNLDRLNPISGLQRMFSLRSLVRLLASIFKVVVISLVLYFTLVGEKTKIVMMADLHPLQITGYVIDICLLMGIRAALALLVLGLLDYGYQRWQYERDLRMSRTEIREELKRMEGDPRVRERRRALQRQLAMQRMMAQVPRAAVVITNPTTLAIALEYNKNMEAPRVLAKGAGFLAERIVALAMEHDIPIVQRRELAQALFRQVDVGQMIPPEFFPAVAEVLAYVYRLTGKRFGVAA
jgi:flagellar biosynthetic protein FlhB